MKNYNQFPTIGGISISIDKFSRNGGGGIQVMGNEILWGGGGGGGRDHS